MPQENIEFSDTFRQCVYWLTGTNKLLIDEKASGYIKSPDNVPLQVVSYAESHPDLRHIPYSKYVAYLFKIIQGPD